MQEFFLQFQDYCKTPGVDSGEARSYAKAIEYLCDYLKISYIDANAIAQIKNAESYVKDKNSAMYKDLLEFLSNRGQKSYLSKGWIRAGLKHFFDFVAIR